MSRIDWTVPALEDLRAIDRWLHKNATPDVAVSIITRIRARARFLEDFPHGGRPHRDGLRILRVIGTSYLIRYRIVADAVQVLRVHHEREDWFVEP
ncbi:hypothetical protein AWL63_06625 [Sphingomonas panacis]|uniref:Addiction module toxin RelE n=1 Tax=Sphingomonas panacis TaxID=1560345 RepID=A0A1B3Z8E3_9SPHN|nr:type II toxin-antitoxin system RelE/ParE family toxin [Sphingomonas panacis]AOH83691.1 hypothetical protein AWL63_06625 [Sphingomonas panacis]